MRDPLTNQVMKKIEILSKEEGEKIQRLLSELEDK